MIAGRIGHHRIFQNALQHGWDGLTAAQRAAVNGSTTVVSSPPSHTAVFAAPGAVPSFFQPVHIDQASLRPVQWLAPGLLQRGEITVLAGQGGSAKTALAVHIATAIAAGLTKAGPFKVYNTSAGRRVAFISAEEDCNRLALLVAATCRVLALDAPERARVAQNVLLHDAQASGWRLGAPRPGQREDIAPDGEERSLNELAPALAGVDVLIMDTLAALFALPNENDNSLATTLMRRLTRVARDAGCAVLLLHHTPKMTRENAALQRGEATLVRGGSAIVNSARVVLTITAPPAAEAGAFVMLALQPDRVRRLEHAKINDAPPMDPSYFAIVSEKVKVHDGSDHAVRAVDFVAAPTAGAGITDAIRNVAMKAIDAGVRDDHGARHPLSPGGGRDNKRDAISAISRELVNANSVLTAPQAHHLAREVLKDLRDRIGCVAAEEVQIPRYKADGQRDGTRKARGLACRWHLAPWVAATAPDPTATRPLDAGMLGNATER